MPDAPLSLVRKLLLWYMKYPPFNPYVSISFSADFSKAQTYLARLREQHDLRVSVQHLVTASLARVYAEFPIANASVFGRRIVRHEQVGAAMPVVLGGEAEKLRGAVGAILVERAQFLSLRELAELTRGRVETERGKNAENAVFRALLPLVDHLPTALFHGLLGAADFLLRLPGVGPRVHPHFPISVVVSNVGAALGLPRGALTRGASFSPPARFLALGTLLGVFPLQDEVFAEDGKTVVRPALPMAYVFDHRLFDGVMCGRILTRLIEVLQAPHETFGPDGERPGPARI